MAVDNTALTTEEIDFLANATLSRRIAKRGEVAALDRVESGTLKYFMAKAKNFGNPVQGGFRFYVKGNRGQKIQWWQGADILTFQNKQTLTDMVFDVGMGHYGYELLYDTIRRNGIALDFNAKGIREGGGDKATMEKVVNIIEQTLDDVEYDWMNDLRKRFMHSNSDQGLCFTGRRGLIDPTTNSTGTIGKRPRSNPLFRHQLVTGVDANNIMSNFFKIVRAANRRAGGSKIDWISCGDDAYNLLVDLFTGTSTVAGKFDYRSAREYAQKKGEKFNISMPQDCFAYEDTLIVNDPVYDLLAQDYPAETVSYSKMIEFWNSSHFGILPVIQEQSVQHAMPYNQRVSRTSIHGEWTVWCDLPSSQGALILA